MGLIKEEIIEMEKDLIKNLFEKNRNGYLKKRESAQLEYKQSFQKPLIPEYARTLAAFANNKGGIIIFGVQDKPHIPIGMKNQKFIDIDQADLEQRFSTYFSPRLEWQKEILEFEDKIFGILSVQEAVQKPIICHDNPGNEKLDGGAIYFRYQARTQKIRYAELRQILDRERAKEHEAWLKHVSSIAEFGPRNVDILQADTGEMNLSDGGRIHLSQEILDNIKFVKEGHFKENSGAPALRLMGDVYPMPNSSTAIDADALYTHQFKDIAKTLQLNSFELQALIHNLNAKSDKTFSKQIKLTSKQNVYRYTDRFVTEARKIAESSKDLERIIDEYKEMRKARTYSSIGKP